MLGKLRAVKRMIIREAVTSGLIRKKLVKVNGKSIMLTNLNESSLLQELALNGFESYENEVVTLIKNLPWDVSAFIDVGANIGYHSILTELYQPNIKIVCVEPFPKNVEYIKKCKRINMLNFELVSKAMDVKEGEKKSFYFPTGKNNSKLSSSASLINSFKGTDGIYNHSPYETVEVETTTLNSIVSPYKGSCLVKLDCEGSELRILESSIPVLERSNVDFIVELMINDAHKHGVFSVMKKYGYEGFLMTNAGLVCEDRALTLPYPDKKNRTVWRNHFFIKKSTSEIKEISEKYYGYWI